MPDADTATAPDSSGRAADPAVAKAIRSTESYEIPDGVVFYDAENPLAWLQADHAVTLDEVAWFFVPEPHTWTVNPLEEDEEEEYWPDEPDEFDPDSLGPAPPDSTPTIRESLGAADDVPDGLFRAFWASVLLLNVALAATSIGLMLIYFRGDYETGGPVLLIGVVAGLGTGRYYWRAKTGYYNKESDETTDSETEGKSAE